MDRSKEAIYPLFPKTEAVPRASSCAVFSQKAADPFHLRELQEAREDLIARIHRHRRQRREAAIRRLVERVLGHAVPAGLEELAVLALKDAGIRVEVVLCNNPICCDAVFAHRGKDCIDSEQINYHPL